MSFEYSIHVGSVCTDKGLTTSGIDSMRCWKVMVLLSVMPKSARTPIR